MDDLFTKVYLINDKGQLVGKWSGRTPRKLKKRQKKNGTYQPPTIVGFNVSELFKPAE